jgi:hypothetical protein
VRVQTRERVDAPRTERRQVSGGEGGEATGTEMRQLLVRIGSELAVITGMLYYFGWVRTRVQAEKLGFASGVLNLSIADHLLKSVNVLFPLLVTLLLLTIVGHIAWVALTRLKSVALSDEGRVRRLSRAAKGLSLLCVVLGSLGSLPPVSNRFLLPVGLTAAVILALVARAMESRVTGKDPWTSPRRWMVALLLVFLVFWDTERIALLFGEQYAADYQARPEQFAPVALYSKDDLNLTAEGVCVARKRTEDQDSYRHRYTRLRLMESATDRYILINDEWADGQGRVFVVIQSDAIRIEFVGRAAATCSPDGDWTIISGTEQ